MEQSSSFVQHQPFQLHSLCQEFQLELLQNDGEEDTTSERRRKSCVQVATSNDEYYLSQVRLKDAYLGGLMEEQRRDLSHQEEEKSEDSDILAAKTWHNNGRSVAQNNKAWEQPLAHGQLSMKVKRIRSLHIAGHINGQENLWKTTWRFYGRFECEYGYLRNVHEYHSSRKRPCHEFTLRKETNLGLSGTIIW